MKNPLHPHHKKIDYSKYAPLMNKPETMYGLPEETVFCTKCIISNQRPSSVAEFKSKKTDKKPTIFFDNKGVCDACRVVEKKEKSVDWDARDKELRELCDRYRSNDKSYDCIVSGSGGKDSFYTSHMLKYEYGMHPLTVTWAPHMYTSWGWENFQAWIHSGFDNFLMTPNGLAHRLLTRVAFENLCHPYQPFILGQKNLAPRMAIQMKIPLVFYGENEAEYGNPGGESQDAKRSWKYFTSKKQDAIHIGGTSVSDLIENYGLNQGDLTPYMPINPNDIESNNINVQYFGYYKKWHPQGCYYYAVENSDFRASPERSVGTYSKYNSIDDKMDDLHYYTTWIKFGIGRATYDAAQEIRNNEITREEGKVLARRFDGEYPERFLSEILKYLSLPKKEFPKASKCFEQPIMNIEYFNHLCDRFRPPHLWQWKNGDWKLRNSV
jgi:N-acetyl sugar amidotransferase